MGEKFDITKDLKPGDKIRRIEHNWQHFKAGQVYTFDRYDDYGCIKVSELPRHAAASVIKFELVKEEEFSQCLIFKFKK